MPEQPIDLRSDTVTMPTDAMRRAMAAAVLGDDVLGDDPTVNALEARAADLLGKEAGLFVASGTMGNLVAQMAHLARGQELIAGREHHLVIDEAAGHAVIVGASARTLADRADGTLDLDDIRAAFRDPTDVHEPISGLITIENTHAHSMGQPLTPAYTRAVIAKARRARKMVGGGMRQAGVLAAAGLVALQDGDAGMIDRLVDDHANARRLAEGIADLEGIGSAGGIAQPSPGRLDPGRVATNFVLFKVDRERASFLAELRARNVLMTEYAHGQIRAATHHPVSAADIDTTIAAVRAALGESRSRRTATEPAHASV